MDNRILAIAVMAHARDVAGVDDDRWISIDRAIEFLEFVEKDAPDIIRYRASCSETPPASGLLQIDDDEFRRAFRKWIDMPPVPAKHRTVEDWMRENDREPWSNNLAWFWDAPGSRFVRGREKLPEAVFDAMGEGNIYYAGDWRSYHSRAAAVADLRQALLSLHLIAE